MNLISVDKMELGPVKVELVKEDKTLTGIVLRHDGRTYRITKDYYGSAIRLHEQRDYAEVEKWVVEGTYEGIPVNMSFDQKHEAETFINGLTSRHELKPEKKVVRVPDVTVNKDEEVPF